MLFGPPRPNDRGLVAPNKQSMSVDNGRSKNLCNFLIRKPVIRRVYLGPPTPRAAVSKSAIRKFDTLVSHISMLFGPPPQRSRFSRAKQTITVDRQRIEQKSLQLPPSEARYSLGYLGPPPHGPPFRNPQFENPPPSFPTFLCFSAPRPNDRGLLAPSKQSRSLGN